MSLSFTGYAAIWDRMDRAGDVMRRGAFAGAGDVPLLWQHRGAAMGHITAMAEDDTGLSVEGMVDDPVLAALVRSGAVAGLSVGYRPRVVHQGAARAILSAELIEISLVTVPMQPLARVIQIFTKGE
ncbi:peptidase U35 [Sphingomonas sp. Sph1(2015)]|jgi:HK97 family phage prohead protease|uniref:HK97 family phage prohead protease n=1 Tax=Sphingomonas sp. Sph1(2015) TaxID=1628084 RepID=UPI000977BFAF|nr:HK97 family phage prohead protease [Sphingomonas sp. Sph1(2015)]OMJ33705.1 peptidase U35 [Sphingomonas sp. Sph1(2015)]